MFQSLRLTPFISSVFYIICGVLNVRLGCIGDKGTVTPFDSLPEYDLDGFPLFWMWVRVRFRFLYLVFQLFPGTYVFLARYTAKYKGRQRRVNKAVADPRVYESPQDLDGRPARRFPSLRLPMELTILITKSLHYTDLVNLRQTSYHFRAVFFGDNDPIQTSRDLQKFACTDGGTSINCEICKVQTCQGRPPLTFHERSTPPLTFN